MKSKAIIPLIKFLAPICFYLLLIFVFIASSSAQSGRVKPSETPTPETRRLPRATIYDPREPKSQTATPPVKPPTSTTKPNEDDGDIIRVDSNLVPIPVSVLDQDGKAVTNLTLENFELQIDGKPAEISDVSRSETPVRLALLFDNSSSVMQAREFEKKAAIRFFRRVLRPETDLAALYSVATGSRLEQPLTKNTESLVQAIENLPPPEGATALLDAIIKASNYLKDSDGRRVIVVVSDGEDTISDATFEETVKAAQAMNCQVYVVKTTEFENYKRTGSRGGNSNIRALAAERRMQDISAQTGGEVYSPVDERELDAAFNQISAELSQQYILSYYPENESDKRGEFRAISLSVKQKPNLTVRTRKGYYVPRQR